MGAVPCKELPEDCWEQILSRLGDHRQWESFSLVSKKHRLITNQLQVSLVVINPSIEVFHKQLQRFQNVKKIDLSSFGGPLDEALLEITQSGVDIEELNISNKSTFPAKIKDLGFKMKNIKVISCSSSYLTDADLVDLAETFPLIEELDLSQNLHEGITDKGISAMSKKLKRLQRINLSGNTKISDKSLISLSSNCESLTEIVLRFCDKVSQEGISRHNSPNPDLFDLTNPLNFSKCTKTIDLARVKISDDLLSGIVKADLPLENFHLSFCQNYTIDAIYTLLEAYPSLKSFSLCGKNSLTDESVTRMCPFITKLNSIKLNSCFMLTFSSFNAIASACSSISKIEIDTLNKRQTGQENASGYAKKPSITSVSLPYTSLERLLHICPDLQTLKVTNLAESNEVDIAFILNSFHYITHLTVDSCKSLKFSGKGGKKLCNLEWLSASNSNIDDEVLKMVAKRCPKLFHLDLEGCMSVTETETGVTKKGVTDIGVREVAEHCKRLRYINLDGCELVNRWVVAWMVDSPTCPSLRKIVTPGRDRISLHLNKFLEKGCLVIPGSKGKRDNVFRSWNDHFRV